MICGLLLGHNQGLSFGVVDGFEKQAFLSIFKN
jgi:hypothetical protein